MYENWFQLSKRPFGAAPQVADYYPSDQMETARKTIVRCLEGGGGPSILIGGPGSGKTTLCLKIREQYQRTGCTGFFSCCGIRSRRELLQQILFAFGRPFNAVDEGELRISLTNFVQSQQEQGTDARAVLLIDDACDLPVEFFDEIRSLSNLTHDGSWCVNVVLAGKSKLEELLARTGMESLNQRIASRNYLNPWNARETTEYLHFQISRAGGDANAIFSEDAIEQVYAITDGLPRLINQICDHAMIMAALGNVRQLDSLNIEESWADLQQLPPPRRKTTAAPAHEDEGAMIEFGTLDEGAGNTGRSDLPSTNAETTEPMADFEFGFLPGDESVSDVPREQNGDSTPQESPTHDLRLSCESQNDLVDRLDDIEREVLRVSHELDGDDSEQDCDETAATVTEPAESLGCSEPCDDPPAPSLSNPFLEIFDEEEVVFGTHNTLNNELVKRQPTVFTSGGEALIDVIRMVDQGPEPSEWELHDDISGSRPAEERLSLELATSTFLNARFEPEIADVNESGADFSESDFVFNYSAPMPTVSTESTAAIGPIETIEAVGPPPVASPEAVFHSAIEAPHPSHDAHADPADLSPGALVESVSEPVPEEISPIFPVEPEGGICGSNVGTQFQNAETIEVDSVAYELSDVTESAQQPTDDHPAAPAQETAAAAMNAETTVEPDQAAGGQWLDEAADLEEESDTSPTDLDQTMRLDQGFKQDFLAEASSFPRQVDFTAAPDEQQNEGDEAFMEDESAADEVYGEAYQEEAPVDAEVDAEDDWAAPREAEPIEQTMILPRSGIKPFSNNTQFGQPHEEFDEGVGAETETAEEIEPTMPEPVIHSEEVNRTAAEQNAANYSKLFSRLKSAGNE